MLAMLFLTLKVAVVTFVILLMAILLWFVWDKILPLLGGPRIDFMETAILMALVLIGVRGSIP